MATYIVSGVVTVSCWTRVEAESEEEAIAIASERTLADIQIDGSAPPEEAWQMDSDGEPCDFRVE